MFPPSPPVALNGSPDGAIATACDIVNHKTPFQSASMSSMSSLSDQDEVALVPLPMPSRDFNSSLPIQPTQTRTGTGTQREGETQTQTQTQTKGSRLDSPHKEPPLDSNSDLDIAGHPIRHEYEALPGGHGLLLFKPTPAQWHEFPSIFSLARRLGAAADGCFKMVLPHEMRHPLPHRAPQRLPANAYKARQIRQRMFWQVSTVPSHGIFSSSYEAHEAGAGAGAEDDYSSTTSEAAVKSLKTLFNKTKDKQMRHVRYRVDVPAWTADQRREAGVPEQSPLHPLKGDQLNHTKAIIPGIHTPYVYESGPFFGATFQLHAEDFRLASLNHLYKGRKIWIVIPATAVDVAERALNRKGKCSQFMRHRAEFFFPERLDKMGIPYRIIDQRPGETVVILPDAYHEGFSTGHTLAEAKNYADDEWNQDNYQPCQLSCKLLTAIPGEFMRPLREGEARIDLCAGYGEATVCAAAAAAAAAAAPPSQPLPLPSPSAPPSPSSPLSSCASFSSAFGPTFTPQQTPSIKRTYDHEAEMLEERGAKQIKVY